MICESLQMLIQISKKSTNIECFSETEYDAMVKQEELVNDIQCILDLMKKLEDITVHCVKLGFTDNVIDYVHIPDRLLINRMPIHEMKYKVISRSFSIHDMDFYYADPKLVFLDREQAEAAAEALNERLRESRSNLNKKE